MKLIFALGALKNYVDRKRWVGGKSNVHVHKVKTLLIYFICLRGVGGQKALKFCLRM